MTCPHVSPKEPSGASDIQTGYYGVPVIHGSHWRWLIVWYFFFGGISGSSAVIAAVARLSGGEESARLARTATYVSFAALLPCPPLLILDLGRPLRFLNMLRTFRPNSPMSYGSWGLAAFGAVSTLAVANQVAQDAAERHGQPIGTVQRQAGVLLAALGALSGFFVAGYTGTLLAATAVPLWAKRPALLGPLFLASAMTSGTAAVSGVHALIPAGEGPITERLHRLEAISTIAEGALLTAWLVSLGSTGKPLLEGRIGYTVLHGVVGAGMALPLTLLAISGRLPRPLRRVAAVAAPALSLCGVLALRFAVVEAGRLSADDPQATFDLTT
jgi:formate-dependent nitrite reductase membrane component NrfD